MQHRYLTKLKDISRAPCQSQNQCFESRERRNGPLSIKCVTSSFALTSWHLFPQRSKAFLKILETIEIYLGSKMTSNKLFVTYERSTCSKSNRPLADACFRVSTVSSRKRVWVTRGHFESVQALLKFFPFENITKVMKFVNLAFFW